jgi:plastocyanin
MRSSLVVLGALVALTAGCNNTTSATDAATTDAFTPTDGGAADSGSDAGTSDAGSDAGTVIDAGTDGGADTGPTTCGATYAGCMTLTDMRGMSSVMITATASLQYTPKCIRISAGTMVTIEGSLLHPLRGATCSPADSPLPMTASMTGGTFTFANPGEYGFYCQNHGTNAGVGMAGLIVVE